VRLSHRAILLAGMMLAACASAPAQISLSTVVDLSLHNDPKVKLAQADLDKAEASVAETRDAYIPSAGINAGYGQSTGVPLGVPVVFSFDSKSLLFNFSQKDYVRAAELGLKAAKLSMKEARDQVAEDAVVTYLNLNHAQQRQAAIDDEYEYASRLVTIVQQRLDAGDDTRIELLKARRTAAQLHLQKLQAEDEIAILSEHLSRMIGFPGNPVSTEPASVPPLPSVATLTADTTSSFGIQAAFATARSKQETAFGDARWRFRPQLSFFLNYSYIDTGPSDYVAYYPNFAGKSRDAASVGIQIVIPLFDRARQDRARGAAADAAHSRAEAQNQRNQFLEGRFKLLHSAAELADRNEVAQDDRDLAQAQLDAVLAQLTPASAATGQPQLTPKDEQNARLQERARYIDLLNAQFELQQAQVNLMRQTGRLDDWLNTIPREPTTVSVAPVHHP
jgi:outer membrane protein TolC